MRIIAGLHRGRTLSAPLGKTTRPTAERVRQALFDTLMHAPWGGRVLFDGCHVLDAFAGTGALGLEAISRGAQYTSFFETNSLALFHLLANIQACHAETQCFVFAQNVTKPPPKLPQNIPPATLIFLDPPYYSRLAPHALHALFRHGWIAPHAIAVLETAHNEIMPFEKVSAPAFSDRITKDTSNKSLSKKESFPKESFPLPVSLLTTRRHGAAYLSFWQFTS